MRGALAVAKTWNSARPILEPTAWVIVNLTELMDFMGKEAQ